MTDPINPSPAKRRLLLAGAGVGGPLIGLLLLMTVFAGDEVAIGVAPAPVPKPAQSTTVPVPTIARDEAPLLATTSDPFLQVVTVPDAARSTDATPILGSSGERLAVGDVKQGGVVASAPEADEPFSFVDSEPPALVRDEEPAVPRTVTDETVTFSSPPTTELPAPTTSISSPSTLPPVTSTVPPATTTIPPTTSTTVGAPAQAVVFAAVRDGNQDIYTTHPAGGAPRRLTHDRATDRDPAWSPDGTTIAFVSERTWRPELFVMRADGTAQARVTMDGGSPARPTWGPDGGSIVFESTDVTGENRELFVLNMWTGVVRRLTSGACAAGPFRACPDGDIAHGQPASSPDGTRIAFVRTDRNGQHLLVMNADGSDIRHLGGIRAANPAWAANGQTIAYDDVDGIRVVSVVSAGGPAHEVVAGTWEECLPGARCPIFFEPSWSPDGTRLTVRDGKVGTTTGDLYVIDLHGQQRTQLTAGAQASGPRWFSPSQAAGGTP